MNKIFSIISLLLFTLAAVCSFITMQKWMNVDLAVISGLWWAFTLAVTGYAIFRKSLTTWILVAMVIGIQIGLHFHSVASSLQALSNIFLKLIKTVIAPILFGSLVVGIAGHSNLKQLGRMGWKSLLYFEIVTTLALCVGLLAINISQAGANIHIPEKLIRALPESSEKQMQRKMIALLDSAHVPIPQNLISHLPDAAPKTWQEHVLDIFPENIAKSVANGEVLPIVVFSVIFGIALSMLSEERKRPMLQFAESLSETMFKFTNIIMYLGR